VIDVDIQNLPERSTLPEGFTVRPAAAEDAPALVALLRADEIAATGETSVSITEVTEWFEGVRARERGVTRVVQRDADVVGVWRVYRNFDDKYWVQTIVDRTLDPHHLDRLWAAGLAWAEHTVIAIAAGLAVDSPRSELWVYENDALAHRQAEAAGFVQVRAFVEMQVDLAEYTPPADARTPVAIRRADIAAADSPDLRTMYEVITESFRDHFDFALRSFDDWVDGRLTDPLVATDHWYLAELGGEPVGGLIGHNSYLESDNAGYIANIGVLRSGRGKGVAKALLHTSFVRYAADGRDAVKLHVDAESPTGATHLYEAVGMYRRLVGFDFHKQLGSAGG